MPESRHEILSTKKATAALQDGDANAKLQAQVPLRLLCPPGDANPGKGSLPGAAGARRELGRAGPWWKTKRCRWCPAPQGVPGMDAAVSTRPVHTYAGEGARALCPKGLNHTEGCASAGSGKAGAECRPRRPGCSIPRRSSCMQPRDRGWLMPYEPLAGPGHGG